MESVSSKDRETFRQYLIQLRDNFETYHARKEQVAWTATALYLTAVSALVYTLVTGYTLRYWVRSSTPFTFVVVVLIFVVALLTSLFIKVEFTSRQVASDIVEACGTLLAELVSPRSPLTYRQIEPVSRSHTANLQSYTWPAVLWERIAQPRRRPPFRRHLARFLARNPRLRHWRRFFRALWSSFPRQHWQHLSPLWAVRVLTAALLLLTCAIHCNWVNEAPTSVLILTATPATATTLTPTVPSSSTATPTTTPSYSTSPAATTSRPTTLTSTPTLLVTPALGPQRIQLRQNAN
jgi:hypothetical protein